eukprot:TRINITY_DN18678_c0_g1_i1.p1 TRINITY_DN18678_c0_g1~~TRINITY_DN18678_c0_g1_i1.p1  ORF type:complete len:261 (+),score=76.51 TRINITY_DN18678_c0_g1_i1:134-916(+)
MPSNRRGGFNLAHQLNEYCEQIGLIPKKEDPETKKPASSAGKKNRKPTQKEGKIQEEELEAKRKETEQAQLQASLRIATDARYRSMDYYKRFGGTNSAHFQKMKNDDSKLKGQDPNAEERDVSQFAVEKRVVEEEPEWVKARQKPVCSVEERLEWNEVFDRQVKKLFVDFDLSEAPACRLNHLDRMHSWFKNHGAKQARQGQKAPNYLVQPRNDDMPPGSARNILSRLSDSSSVLKGVYTTPVFTVDKSPKFTKVVPFSS